MSLYDRDYMRPHSPRGAGFGFQMDAFRAVFWLNVVVFVMQYVFGIGMQVVDGYWQPMGAVSLDLLAEGRVWTMFTYMFVHGSLGHVLVNLLMLWFVGKQVHQIFGGAHFVRIYLFSGVLGAALELAVRAWLGEGTGVPLVGASAAVFGLFLVLAVTLPNEVLTALIYFVIPVRARMWTLAMWLLGINLVLGLLSLVWAGMPGGNTAYFAHLGGALTGWYYVRLMGYDGNPLVYRRLWRGDDGGEDEAKGAMLRLQAALVERRKKALNLDLDEAAIARQRGMGEKEDVMVNEVDPILDKISELGLGSLTEEERRTLERASRVVKRNLKGGK